MKHFFKYAAGSAALAAIGLLAPMTSHAFLIDSTTVINSQFTVNYLLEIGDTDGNGNVNETETQNSDTYTAQDINATVIYTLKSFSMDTDTIGFQLDVTNTSADLGNEVGLLAIAFGTDPNATGVTFKQIPGDADKFISATLSIDPQLNNAVANLDVQSSTDTGANNTLREQELDKFLLDVTFSSLDSSGVIFTPFGSEWQTIVPSFQFGGSEGGGPQGPPLGVPEPGILALLGIGLLGMGATRCRRRI